jgi:predicted nucleic acid-binding protein
MTFASVPSGAALFLDANTLIYHFTSDAKYGPACTQLIKRIELRDVTGFTSAHALADVAHRRMTPEVIKLNGWPQAGIAARLRKHHDEIPKRSVYHQAIAAIPQQGIRVLPIAHSHIEAAMACSVETSSGPWMS